MKKSIGVLGSGIVGITLANGLKNAGYQVALGNRKGSKVEKWDGEVGEYATIAQKSELIILAVKGAAAEDVVSAIKLQLANKTVIDTTNPISDNPPDEGLISFFTNLNESLMEKLQLAAPETHFVKAFNSVGNAYMVNPHFNDGKTVMFICGNDADAKNEAAELLSELGWDSEDFGGVKSARVIEPLCILWCLPGMLRNEWSHAFTVLKS
jgi:8-hydroxy-5-deazaflavin:NADPH oxidoreductase